MNFCGRKEVANERRNKTAHQELYYCLGTLPGFPYAKEILAYVSKVSFLALATPIIAFASLSIAKDLDEFKRAGWRIVVAALITLFAVFFTAAVIAEVILRIQGYPR